MNNYELIEKWLSAFGKNVDEQIIKDYVTSYGGFLWHLFTWGKVPCLKEDEAKRAFDNLQYKDVIIFFDGYSNSVKDVSSIEKISADDIDKKFIGDVYIVANDFSWTYVRTHEAYCGPYFCLNK